MPNRAVENGRNAPETGRYEMPRRPLQIAQKSTWGLGQQGGTLARAGRPR